MKVSDKILSALPPMEEKKRNFMLGGILLVIFAVDYFLVLAPQLSALQTLNPKLTLLSQDLKKAETDVQRINQYQQEAVRLKDNVDLVNKKFRVKEDVPLILENLSRIANRYNFRIDQIMPLVDSQKLLLTNKEGKFYALQISIEGRSAYHDFGRFINEMEGDDPSLTIERFSFAAKGP
ncbi:MAG: type 4a pilus biogenesis protein PilO, partial [Candidatus Omnitrophota bacterium]